LVSLSVIWHEIRVVVDHSGRRGEWEWKEEEEEEGEEDENGKEVGKKK